VSRIDQRLKQLRAEGRKALVTFITAGDPDRQASVPALHALVAGGADILELGVPFSDPEAEGPAIQRSSERGLASGTTLSNCLDMVSEFRRTDPETPVVLMGYINSVLAMGVERFAARAAEAGADGLIMVNLPPEEGEALKLALAAHDLNLIYLLAPTTTDTRARQIIGEASGFLYYVSLKGITGADHLDISSVAERLAWVKQQTDVPLMVGFGIKDGASAAALSRHADGVVVGSVLVNTMAAATEPRERVERLQSQAHALRAALDGATKPSG
jgi:tryptophan synthase alpha chain